MLHRRTLPGVIALIASIAAISASASTDLHGQWVGNSQLDGSRAAAKTTLVLGYADSDDSTLRLDDRNPCTLRGGTWTSAANDAVTLSFKDANGSEACERLARGRFTLLPGTAPRSLRLEVAYPGPDGGENVRHGVLTRYP